MDINQRYFTLLEAIEKEKKAEETFFKSLSENKSTKEKVDEGFAWYPIEIVSVHYSVGENLEVKIRRKTNQNKDHHHKFKVGISVNLFNSQPDTQTIRGVISYYQKDTLSILTNANREDIEEFDKGLSGIEIMYDEKPYLVMKTAILKVMESKRPMIQVLKKALAERALQDNLLPPEEIILPVWDQSVNDSQKNALLVALQAKYLSIIHGPPGTGKTTTLVALTKALLQKEKHILVCASSNNAVDVLASRLHKEGLRVLRVGNITRIHDDLADLTLIEKLRNHPEWGNIKKIKVQSEQLLRQARQFKRSFDHSDREKRKRLKNESHDLRKWSREMEDRLSDEILHNSQVIATTLVSAGHSLLNNMFFETVIIDEASQALEPECWNAILKSERVILAGDHLQLPPTVKSTEAIKMGLDVTILDIMTENIAESSLLTMQYRMNEAILGFSNKLFYHGKLESHSKVQFRTLPNDDFPLIFIDTAGCGFDEVQNPKQKSYKNEGEFFILREFVMQKKEILSGAEIGIISPYAEQVRYIVEESTNDEVFSGLDVEIETIDGIQGQEKDVIFISLVRSNDKSEIGFLKDERRLNVAMTRARKKLVIIGDSATIGNHPLYENLLIHIEKYGFLDSAWNYMKY